MSRSARFVKQKTTHLASLLEFAAGADGTQIRLRKRWRKNRDVPEKQIIFAVVRDSSFPVAIRTMSMHGF